MLLPLAAQRLASSAQFVELLAVQQGLQQQPEVRHAGVTAGVNAFSARSRKPRLRMTAGFSFQGKSRTSILLRIDWLESYWLEIRPWTRKMPLAFS
jgi:hypothetical protein